MGYRSLCVSILKNDLLAAVIIKSSAGNYTDTYPVSIRRRFDVHTTSITLKRRRMDVKTTSCVRTG